MLGVWVNPPPPNHLPLPHCCGNFVVLMTEIVQVRPKDCELSDIDITCCVIEVVDQLQETKAGKTQVIAVTLRSQ